MNVFNLAWLTDEQIYAFKSDFKIVAEYLRAVRVGEAEDWERQKIEHVEEICDLLKAISNDDIFDSMQDFIIDMQKNKGGFQMSEFVQKMINRGRTEGISIGRTEGISQGMVLGRNEGISSMASLLATMYAQGRSKDVERAVTDSEYLKQLFAEYNIQYSRSLA